MSADIELDSLRQRVKRLEDVLGLSPVCAGTFASRSALIRYIQAHTAARHRVRMQELLGRRRIQRLVNARHEAIYLAREITGASYESIGLLFHRDHGTIQNAIQSIRDQRDINRAYDAQITELLVQLKTTLLPSTDNKPKDQIT